MLNNSECTKLLEPEYEALLDKYAKLRNEVNSYQRNQLDKLVDLFETSYLNSQSLLTKDFILYYFANHKKIQSALDILEMGGVAKKVQISEVAFEKRVEQIKTGSPTLSVHNKIFYTIFMSKEELKKLYYEKFKNSFVKALEDSAMLLANPVTWSITTEQFQQLKISQGIKDLTFTILKNNDDLSVVPLPVILSSSSHFEAGRQHVIITEKMIPIVFQQMNIYFSAIYNQQKSLFTQCLHHTNKKTLFSPIANEKGYYLFTYNDLSLMSAVILKYSSAFRLAEKVLAQRVMLFISLNSELLQNQEQNARMEKQHEKILSQMSQKIYHHLSLSENLVPEQTLMESLMSEGLPEEKSRQILATLPKQVLSFKVRHEEKSIRYFVDMKYLYDMYLNHVQEPSPLSPLVLAAFKTLFFLNSCQQCSTKELLAYLRISESELQKIFQQFRLPKENSKIA